MCIRDRLSAVLDYQYRSDRKGESNDPVIKTYGLPGYPRAHAKHPCTLWARDSKENAMWLVKHMRALCLQYFYRYQKFHKMDGYPLIYEAQLENCVFPFNEQTEFVQAITNTCLLYTSPSPRDRQKSRMPSSA